MDTVVYLHLLHACCKLCQKFDKSDFDTKNTNLFLPTATCEIIRDTQIYNSTI